MSRNEFLDKVPGQEKKRGTNVKGNIYLIYRIHSVIYKSPNEKPNQAQQPAEQARPTTEQETLNSLVKQGQGTAVKQGKTAAILVGERKITGRWNLVDAFYPKPSHNPLSFHKTEGFPVRSDGTTVNDRDYEHDKEAQAIVRTLAQKYGVQALNVDDPIVMTKDTIVVSGNNRTMSSQLAALHGTDTEYLKALHNKISEFGFTEDDIQAFDHPRIVFETDETLPYTTETFALFNLADKKTMNKTESAVKMSKLIDIDTLKNISTIISSFEELKHLYESESDVRKIFDLLAACGVITQTELPEYIDHSGTISNSGREFLEVAVLSSFVNEENIRRLSNHRRYRQTLVRGLLPLVQTMHKNGFNIKDDINDAIDIAIDAEIHGTKISEYRHATTLWEGAVGNGSVHTDTAVEIAEQLTGSQANFTKFLKTLGCGTNPNSQKGGIDIHVPDTQTTTDVWEKIQETKEKMKALTMDRKDYFSSEQTFNTLKNEYAHAAAKTGSAYTVYMQGNPLTGHWKLVEAESPQPSHDAVHGFQQTRGFPVNEHGRTVNDRDYEHDSEAQSIVQSIASNYNEKALAKDSPVVVTTDGIVLSGNNRTMSSQIAARKGTDTEYIKALHQKASEFGFTEEDIQAFDHPRVIFETTETLPYTTKTFAAFNRDDKKTMGNTETTVKISRLVTKPLLKRITQAVLHSDEERLAKYSSFQALSTYTEQTEQLFSALVKEHILSTEQVAQYTDKGNNVTTLNAKGRDYISDVLLGSVLREPVIRTLANPLCNHIRTKIMHASVSLVVNRAMNSAAYTFNKELNQAVSLAARCAIQHEDDIDTYLEKRNEGEPLAVSLAKLLSRTTAPEFSDIMNKYALRLEDEHESGGGFDFGEPATKQDIFNEIIRTEKRRAEEDIDTLTKMLRVIVRSEKEGILSRDEQQMYDTTTQKIAELKRYTEKLAGLDEGTAVPDNLKKSQTGITLRRILKALTKLLNT
jgi:hypothetical protein